MNAPLEQNGLPAGASPSHALPSDTRIQSALTAVDFGNRACYKARNGGRAPRKDC